jgi:F0F1-type ATP synthase assembly protein I
MSFNKNYIIPTPFNLVWSQVSGTESYGLEYHLTADLSIRMEELFSGNDEFPLGQYVINDDLRGTEKVNQIQIDNLWRTEFMPAKTSERIQRFFREGNITCFFSERHMKRLEEKWTNGGYTSGKVSVIFQGKIVNEIIELPPKEFKLIMDAFDELNVQATIDYRNSKQEMEEDYREAYEKKIAKREKYAQKNMFDKLREKHVQKKAAFSIGAIVLGISGYIAKRFLSTKGPWGIAASIVLGTIGVICEVYGQTELNNVTNSLLSKVDRGGYNL